MTERRAVTVTMEDHVAWITLDDVERRNSLNPVLVGQLAAACAEVRDDRDVRAVVLRARGPVFSAGGDIDALGVPAEDPTAVYAGFRALAGLPVPVLAAVHAPVIGAGVNFVLACDVVVAARSATFDPRFLDVAIHPGGGHLWRMEQRAGRQGTAAMVLFGDTVTAEEAERCGLVWRCVEDDDLLDVSRRLTARVAGRSPELVRRTKATMRLSRSLTDPRMAAELEQAAQDWSMRQPSFTEAVRRLRDLVRTRA
ncbi:enoyl-CoA hydratase-related protein [Nonomuraea cavernae]|uniref:Enoyl-CoA hydratase n=1 Tax=Nonomuraea cavernae TaxID=2045107 RepID=A0A917ZIQ7_9ACTN|nr:enoyl-CoA hydratase-related protein [Nonomuraea cavernae]MCA2186417.1 enoyl-CoA hydratase/isomerase family protein [Nonomuraea cavernae]GGO82764.1 enoyl-CoA hydratase [Nonomuraea cavernae]